jgi:hypothetical protein
LFPDKINCVTLNVVGYILENYPLIESATNLLNFSVNFHPYLKLMATDYKTLREIETDRETEREKERFSFMVAQSSF